jgi:tubulin polyglutamylase TTLL9
LLDKLRLYLISKFGVQKVEECFLKIQKLIIKTLSAGSQIIVHDKRCFALYGFDVLLDDDLRPWLLEVNGSPSMTANTKEDKDLKVGVLDDVFTILNLEKLLTGEEEQVGGFDLIYKGKPVNKPDLSNDKSMLGCLNDR